MTGRARPRRRRRSSEACSRGRARAIGRAISEVERDRAARPSILRAPLPADRARADRRHHGAARRRQVHARPAARAGLSEAAADASAIVAVDPSSPFTGGAILGDRIRMSEIYTDPGVFIRSMATRGALGGLARATGDAVDVLDAAGFDVVILIETVGVGQDEVDIVQRRGHDRRRARARPGRRHPGDQGGHPRDRRRLRRQQGGSRGRGPRRRGARDDARLPPDRGVAPADRADGRRRAARAWPRPSTRSPRTPSSCERRARARGARSRRARARLVQILRGAVRARRRGGGPRAAGPRGGSRRSCSPRREDPYAAAGRLSTAAMVHARERVSRGPPRHRGALDRRGARRLPRARPRGRAPGRGDDPGRRAAFLPVGESRLELLEPTSAESPVAKFLAKRGAGTPSRLLRGATTSRRRSRISRARGFRLIHRTPRARRGRQAAWRSSTRGRPRRAHRAFRGPPPAS